MDQCMRLLFLEATNFKNHRKLQMAFNEDVNGFSGRNGAGKTNILDAIHYLCLAKSHFSATDAEIPTHGEQFFRLAGAFEDRNGQKLKVEVKVEPGKRKEVILNGKKFQALSEYVGLIPVLFQAPDDIYHLLEQSMERRKWLDRALSQQDVQYLRDLIAYNRLLKQRNAWLKKTAETGRGDQALLEWYDVQLAPLAAGIAEKRSDYMEEINQFFQPYYQQISHGREQVKLSYAGIKDPKEWEQIWLDDRVRDMTAQRTCRGIHRDDLEFEMEEKPLRRIGSQGQIKSYILALVLSQYKATKELHGKVPILLLDDIFARLDQERVSALLKFLKDEGMGSVFVTDTDHDRLKSVMERTGHAFRIFKVDTGLKAN